MAISYGMSEDLPISLMLIGKHFDEASQELLDLMGFKVWFSREHLVDQDSERITRDIPIIGELKP